MFGECEEYWEERVLGMEPWYIKRRIEGKGFIAQRILCHCLAYDENIYGHGLFIEYNRSRKKGFVYCIDPRKVYKYGFYP